MRRIGPVSTDRGPGDGGGDRGGVRGRGEIRQRYLAGSWSTGTPRDALRFADLDVCKTGPGTAIAFGRYILCERDSGESTATGVLSLTLHRPDEVWRIVHDHSSADESV